MKRGADGVVFGTSNFLVGSGKLGVNCVETKQPKKVEIAQLFLELMYRD